jgi:hypothetical protein
MDFKFMVHVGDIKHGHTSCYESSFSDVADIFSHESNAINYDLRDCFFVPGDNEFQDCQDKHQAYRWWMKCKSSPIPLRWHCTSDSIGSKRNTLPLILQILAMASSQIQMNSPRYQIQTSKLNTKNRQTVAYTMREISPFSP